MIVKWIVKCDGCGKLINALEEEFIEGAYGEHYCMECYNSL